MGNTSVAITIFTWFWPWIYDILLVLHWWRDIWLQIEGDQQLPCITVIAHEVWELWTIHQESLYWRCVTLDTAHGLLR